MYTPRHNRVDDRDARLAFMREHSFAALVTRDGEAGLRATHLPFLIVDGADGLRLIAHLARANPQWQDFATAEIRGEALVIFSGPHAYVSPRLYQAQPSVPTWNYLAVHACGSARRLDSRDDKLKILGGLIDAHDPGYRAAFAALPEDYLAGKLDGIVAFEIAVTRLEARFKLSQDRSPAERAIISAALAVSDDGAARALAAQMDHGGK